MDRAQLYKLTELIVAEVVRRIAQEERRRQHPEQVLVLLADSVSFPEKLQQTLNEQFGVAYTPVSIPETNTFADEALLYAGKLEPGGLLERVKEAKTVILVSPRLELLRRIASGDDGDRCRICSCAPFCGRRMSGCISITSRPASAAIPSSRTRLRPSIRCGRWP